MAYAGVARELEARGFRVSRPVGRYIRVSCDQCEALVVNGTATHESGCIRATRECRGCGELIPARQVYCDDCGR